MGAGVGAGVGWNVHPGLGGMVPGAEMEDVELDEMEEPVEGSGLTRP